jgi:hypothetical protein
MTQRDSPHRVTCTDASERNGREAPIEIVKISKRAVRIPEVLRGLRAPYVVHRGAGATRC